MRLEVPYWLQTTKFNCAPAALRMVLAYFDKDYEIELLEEKSELKEGLGASTIQIAIAAAKLGYGAEFFSKNINFDESNMQQEFYKKYSDLSILQKKFIEEAKRLNVKIEEKSLTINEVLEKLTENSIPIILLDWNIIKGMKVKGYHGHFVPIVGYNKSKIIVHNHGLNNPKPFTEIDKNLFEEARKAKGTDEDVVVIFRKIS